MATDLRLSVGLFRNPKLRKLVHSLGPGAAWSLVGLWAFAADQRTDGDLSGLDDTDIEIAAEWSGEPGALVAALVSLRWLDGEPGARSLHDWAVHQPWLAGAADRSEASRWAALCKRYGRAGAAARMPDYAGRVPDSADRMRAAPAPQADSMPPPCGPRAPSPIPSPIPKADPPRFDIVEASAGCPIDDVPSATMRNPAPADAAELMTPAPSAYRGQACVAMRQAGIIQTNPSHADLIAAEREGVPLEVWGPTAAECLARGKSTMAYTVATARQRHRDAARPLDSLAPVHAYSAGPRESVVARVQRKLAELEEYPQESSLPAPIDVEFSRVGSPM